jgi:hypothetical protein
MRPPRRTEQPHEESASGSKRLKPKADPVPATEHSAHEPGACPQCGHKLPRKYTGPGSGVR